MLKEGCLLKDMFDDYWLKQRCFKLIQETKNKDDKDKLKIKQQTKVIESKLAGEVIELKPIPDPQNAFQKRSKSVLERPNLEIMQDQVIDIAKQNDIPTWSHLKQGSAKNEDLL